MSPIQLHLLSARMSVLCRVDDVHVQDYTNLAAKQVEQNGDPLLISNAFEQAKGVAECASEHPNFVARGKTWAVLELHQAIGILTASQSIDDRVGDYGRNVTIGDQSCYADG